MKRSEMYDIGSTGNHHHDTRSGDVRQNQVSRLQRYLIVPNAPRKIAYILYALFSRCMRMPHGGMECGLVVICQWLDRCSSGIGLLVSMVIDGGQLMPGFSLWKFSFTFINFMVGLFGYEKFLVGFVGIVKGVFVSGDVESKKSLHAEKFTLFFSFPPTPQGAYFIFPSSSKITAFSTSAHAIL